MPQGKGTYGTQRGRPSKESTLKQRGHEEPPTSPRVKKPPPPSHLGDAPPPFDAKGVIDPDSMVARGKGTSVLQKRSGFTMRSGNSPMFKHMGSSPMKDDQGVNHIHDDGTIHDKDGNDKGIVEKPEGKSPMDFTYAGKDYKNVGEYIKTIQGVTGSGDVTTKAAKKAQLKSDFSKTKVGQAWQEIKGIFSKK